MTSQRVELPGSARAVTGGSGANGLSNHDCKTSCGLIRDGLFTNWRIGFDSDPRPHGLNLHVLELFYFVF